MRKKLGVWPHETALGQHGGFMLSAKSAVQHYSAIGCSYMVYKIMEILILCSTAFFLKKNLALGGSPRGHTRDRNGACTRQQRVM